MALQENNKYTFDYKQVAECVVYKKSVCCTVIEAYNERI